MAAAMTQMASTAHEIARNIQDTNGQVTEARSSCEHRVWQRDQTGQLQALVEEISRNIHQISLYSRASELRRLSQTFG